jgi:hypothetical protein
VGYECCLLPWIRILIMKTLVHGDMAMQCYVTWMGSSSVLTPVSPLFVHETVMQNWSKGQSTDSAYTGSVVLLRLHKVAFPSYLRFNSCDIVCYTCDQLRRFIGQADHLTQMIICIPSRVCTFKIICIFPIVQFCVSQGTLNCNCFPALR